MQSEASAAARSRWAERGGLMHLTGRRLAPERMDDPQIADDELRKAHRYLTLSNRLLGGHGLIIRLFESLVRGQPRGEPIRILDLGTGSADYPLVIDDWAKRTRRDVRITAVDLHEKTLTVARERAAGRDAIEIVRGDARRLGDDFAAGSFDFVHAGLFLHHLHDVDVLTVLAVMDRLASRAAIWNDLIRSPLTKAAIRALAWGPAIFRHDAIVSFDAGFTRGEALDMTKRADWTRPRWSTLALYRFVVVTEKL